MKKIVSLLLVLVMVLSLCACGAKKEEAAPAAPAASAPAASVEAKATVYAVEAGSAGEAAALDAGFEIISVETQAAALMEVAAGTSDACVIDITMANAMTGEGTSYADLGYSVSLTSEEYGVAFRKNSDLTEKLNAFMDKLIADGTLQKLAEKYEQTLVD